MFIESLKLSNFKGFTNREHEIHFNIPNENLGSGLNIFVGENNSGKSTIFEAIDFLRNGVKDELIPSIKNKLPNGEQPNQAVVELTFCGTINSVIDNFCQANKRQNFLNAIDDSQNLKVSRNTEEVKKLYLWNRSTQNYENPTGIDAPFKKLFETNFIWADTNPNDEAAFGSTTLCGLLLKEIAQSHIESDEYRQFQTQFNNVFNDPSSTLRQEISKVEQKVQAIFTEQFGQANIHFQFEELKIDSFFKNTSIFINDGVDVPMSSKGNGMQRVLALSLLQVYAEELANREAQEISKPFYLFIDEPEICLHPKGQIKLLNSLLEISRTKQVFLTTHSPYFLSTRYLSNAGLFIFSNDGITNSIENALSNKMFPWSPTWGEINFKAYKLPTVELHNELYGRLQDISQQYYETKFDKWLVTNGLQISKQWTQETQNGTKNHQVTLQTFIRNHIHHPENQTMRNNPYTENELFQSIEEMISLLSTMNNSSV